MSTLPPLTFASWVPASIIDVAKRLSAELATEKNPAEAFEVLSRLISDPRMQRVWQELYKKVQVNHHPTKEFFYPACVTNASQAAKDRKLACELRNKGGGINERDARLLEAEAALLESERNLSADLRWSEQDRAVQIFLRHAYRDALDCEPVFLSALQSKASQLRQNADAFRKAAGVAPSLGMKHVVEELNELASLYDDEAWNVEPEQDVAFDRVEESVFSPHADDPWIITRKRSDPKVRTFVADLSITTELCFGKLLLGTLATTANVVFCREDMTGEKVWEMLGVPPGFRNA